MTSPFTEAPTLSEKIDIHPSFPIISHYYVPSKPSFPNHVSFPTKILGLQEVSCCCIEVLQCLITCANGAPWL